MSNYLIKNGDNVGLHVTEMGYFLRFKATKNLEYGDITNQETFGTYYRRGYLYNDEINTVDSVLELTKKLGLELITEITVGKQSLISKTLPKRVIDHYVPNKVPKY